MPDSLPTCITSIMPNWQRTARLYGLGEADELEKIVISDYSHLKLNSALDQSRQITTLWMQGMVRFPRKSKLIEGSGEGN